jgi:2-oxoglutarate ferredoxin oxidoreductase subunit delta
MKGKIVIDRELCKGCTYCMLNCPKHIIEMDTEFNKSGFYPAVFKDGDKCTGCALCAVVCPDIAIEVYREEKEKKK